MPAPAAETHTFTTACRSNSARTSSPSTPAFTNSPSRTCGSDKLYSGCRWAEGPAWFGGGRYLVWSDIPNDRMLRWDDTDGSVSVFRQPARYTNGHTIDGQGRLVSCEHGARCISRTEHDGRRAVLATQFEGKRLCSPNDVVVHSDGSIWFSDPSYGIDSDYEGDAAPNEMGTQGVYRIDATSGALTRCGGRLRAAQTGSPSQPDESLLYITDTGATHRADGPRHVRRFRVGAGGTLSGGEVFATCPVGLYDGLRVDARGNLWLSTGEGVHCHRARRHAAGQGAHPRDGRQTVLRRLPSTTGCSSAPRVRSTRCT